MQFPTIKQRFPSRHQESNLEQLFNLFVFLNMHLPISPTLPETNIAPARTPSPKGNNRLSTIHFQARWLLVSRRDICCSHVSLSLGAETPQTTHVSCLFAALVTGAFSLATYQWTPVSRWGDKSKLSLLLGGVSCREKCHGGLKKKHVHHPGCFFLGSLF